jgi:hypothetical protein
LNDETPRVKVATLSKYALEELADDLRSERVVEMKTRLLASSTPLFAPSKELSSAHKSISDANAISAGEFIW